MQTRSRPVVSSVAKGLAHNAGVEARSARIVDHPNVQEHLVDEGEADKVRDGLGHAEEEDNGELPFRERSGFGFGLKVGEECERRCCRWVAIGSICGGRGEVGFARQDQRRRLGRGWLILPLPSF